MNLLAVHMSVKVMVNLICQSHILQSRGQSSRCNFGSWSIAPKPSLDDILKATGGALQTPSSRNPTLLETLATPCMKQRGAVPHGDTDPCFMDQSVNIMFIDWYSQ